MQRSAIVLTVTSMLALGAAARAQTTSNTTDPTQGSNTSQQLDQLSGVITKIDPGASTMTVVTPAGNSAAAANLGKSLVSVNGEHLVSLNAPVDQQAQISVDGKRATLADLKEGEVVRTSFNAKTNKFESVSAVTQHQVDQDVNKARDNLSQDLNKLHLGSGQSSSQQNTQTNQ